jgi:dephospho-CoA kinase
MGQQSEVNRVLVVDVPKELQIARAAERDNNSCQQIESIIASQISRAERIKLADDVLDNSGDIQCLKNKVFDLHKKYLELAKS